LSIIETKLIEIASNLKFAMGEAWQKNSGSRSLEDAKGGEYDRKLLQRN